MGAHSEDSAATGVNGDQADNSADGAGAVYLFTRNNGGVWVQEAYIKASNSGQFDSFGWSIAFSGDGNMLAVGAHGEESAATGLNGNQADNGAAGAGAVYLFTRSNGGVWIQQDYVKASNAGPDDLFGASVVLSGDANELVVGASREDSSAKGVNGDQMDNSAFRAGAAYVFVRDVGGPWRQETYIKASNTASFILFGSSVALSADGVSMVVAADGEGGAATGVNGDQTDRSMGLLGSVYVFKRFALGDIIVPEIVSLPQVDAEAAIIADGLIVGTITEAYSVDVPPGTVLRQHPLGGAFIAPGLAVNLDVSKLPDLAIPDVVNLSQADAEAAIIAAGLTVGVVTTAGSDTVPAGSVISQDPAAGSFAIPGDPVDLTVSSGPANITVPNVVNLPQADAEAAIVAAGLVVGNVSAAPSNTVPEGSVISQNPAANTFVSPGSAVDLVVSLGALSTNANLSDLTVTNATLVPVFDSNQFDYTATVGFNVVSTQVTATAEDPAASIFLNIIIPMVSGVASDPINLNVGINFLQVVVNAEACCNSTIYGITITRLGEIVVPNVVNLAQADAESAIVAAGLTVGTVTTASSDTVPVGEVISQSPASGSLVAPGSAVDLTVSSGPANIVVPNVVNLAQANAEAAIVAAGLSVGTVSTAGSFTVPTGDVISQNPIAGASVVPGSPVNIVVSTGPPSDNADLSNIVLSNISLSSPFTPTRLNHFATVGFGVSSTVVVVTAEDPDASITIDGSPINSGELSPPIQLIEGANLITIVVIARDAVTSKTYTVNVNRQGATVFAQEAFIKSSDPVVFGEFSSSSANFNVSGNVLLTSDGTTLFVSSSDLPGGSDIRVPAINIFGRDINDKWEQKAYVEVPVVESFDADQIRLSLSNDGNQFVVGLPYARSCADANLPPGEGARWTGRVLVYENDGSNVWNLQACVTGSNTEPFDEFGTEVAISGDASTISVGAWREASLSPGINGPQDDNTGSSVGAVYVYVRDAGGTWIQQAYVKASNPDTSDVFGGYVALSDDGDTLAVGASGEDSLATTINGDQGNGAVTAGAAYVFARDAAGSWAQQAYIKPSSLGSYDRFGVNLKLAADGNTLAVASRPRTNTLIPDTGYSHLSGGIVYIFVRDVDGVWTQQAAFLGSNTNVFHLFASSLALAANGDMLAAGAYTESSHRGRVYFFTRAAGAWTQDAIFFGSNSTSGDGFGQSIDIADSANGIVLVAGAADDSASPGINGDQNDNSLTNSGAAYMFKEVLAGEAFVPNVMLLSQATAEALIVQEGFVVGTVTEEASLQFVPGSVVRQNALPGATVAPGSTVNLVVATAPPLIAVPTVVNLLQADADAAIVAAGFAVGAATFEDSDIVPFDRVISQDPAAGSLAPTGSAVDLTVSLGPTEVAVPDVVNLAQADAEAAITSVGLAVGVITTANSDTVPAGNVISQSPVAGSLVIPGSAVDMTVSIGPPDIVVPAVVNLAQADAEAAIISAGFVVGNVSFANSDTVPVGDVISQDPVGGSFAAPGSAIDLTVSDGPPDVAVPDVVNLAEADAEAAIIAANLFVGFVTTATSDTVAEGNVISQVPIAGTMVPPETSIDLVISVGPVGIAVPNVVGLPQADAAAAIVAAGLTVGNVVLANSNTVPEGNVIGQNPVAAVLAAPGSAVDLIVSSGIGRIVEYPGPPPIDTTIIDQLPVDPDTGLPIIMQLPEASLQIDLDRKNPITGWGQCTAWIAGCLNPEADHDLDDCALSVPTCATNEPWLEPQTCCPTACYVAYRNVRLAGAEQFEAFVSVYLEDGSCYPGLLELTQ